LSGFNSPQLAAIRLPQTSDKYPAACGGDALFFNQHH
jgi:hypothetical protein